MNLSGRGYTLLKQLVTVGPIGYKELAQYHQGTLRSAIYRGYCETFAQGVRVTKFGREKLQEFEDGEILRKHASELLSGYVQRWIEGKRVKHAA